MHKHIIVEEKQFVRAGRIVNLRTSRKCHKCDECGMLIEEGKEYYSLVWGHSGLGALKFPDRVHKECLEGFLGK